MNLCQVLWKKGIISSLDTVVREGFTEEAFSEKSLERYIFRYALEPKLCLQRTKWIRYENLYWTNRQAIGAWWNGWDIYWESIGRGWHNQCNRMMGVHHGERNVHTRAEGLPHRLSPKRKSQKRHKCSQVRTEDQEEIAKEMYNRRTTINMLCISVLSRSEACLCIVEMVG